MKWKCEKSKYKTIHCDLHVAGLDTAVCPGPVGCSDLSLYFGQGTLSFLGLSPETLICFLFSFLPLACFSHAIDPTSQEILTDSIFKTFLGPISALLLPCLALSRP